MSEQYYKKTKYVVCGDGHTAEAQCVFEPCDIGERHAKLREALEQMLQDIKDCKDNPKSEHLFLLNRLHTRIVFALGDKV